jgi:hypothetical protein
LAAKIRTLSDKIKTAPDELAELVDTLATWKRDHAALVKEIEAATVPLQTTFLHCRRLIAHMDGLAGSELADMRREVRLSVGVVISRIDVERAENEVNISVTFKDGTKRGMWYGTKAGRIVAYGATWTGEGVDEEQDGFLENIIDVSPADIARIQCREMREAGKTYKEIQAATGLHRVTIYRYLRR